MPITLEKLFSPTLDAPLEYLGDTVNVVWAPFRWTGEMQELADQLSAEAVEELEAIAELKGQADDETRPEAERAEAAAASEARGRKLDQRSRVMVREFLSKLLVSWDVLDGRTPVGTDVATLKTLPDPFLRFVFEELGEASSPDPQKASSSDEPSSTETSSAPSPTGTTTSARPGRSGSRRSSLTNGHTAPAATRSGGRGRGSSKPSSPPSSSASPG